MADEHDPAPMTSPKAQVSGEQQTLALAREARLAARALARSSDLRRQSVLQNLATQIDLAKDEILRINAAEVERAQARGMDTAFIDRLLLNEARLRAMAAELIALAQWPDPLAESFDHRTLNNGTRVHRRRVPLGLLGVIYEARPNVTVDCAALAIRTGNGVVLRGSSETLGTNRALMACIQKALALHDLPAQAVVLIDDPDRRHVDAMLQATGIIDLIIPRGNAALHERCKQNARVPVITGGIGICHLFVDRHVTVDAALNVIFNAKVQRPTVCNALDTVLLHSAIGVDFLPRLVQHMRAAGVRMRLDERALAVLPEQLRGEDLTLAGARDFDTEWLSLTLGIALVDDIDAAIAHIEHHGSGHSDGILSDDAEIARQFLDRVDSAAVYWNASTRFTDGAQLELGSEVAVSTQKVHARGPMGLEALTSYKWIITGDYHIRP